VIVVHEEDTVGVADRLGGRQRGEPEGNSLVERPLNEASRVPVRVGGVVEKSVWCFWKEPLTLCVTLLLL